DLSRADQSAKCARRRVSGEDARDGIRIRAEVRGGNRREELAEIGRDRQIAPFEALGRRESWPSAVDAAADRAAEREHRRAVTVIGSAVAVLGRGPAELGHREDDGVRESVAEIERQRGDAACEVVKSSVELRGLVDVVVPLAALRERDLETDI